jgi:hypothetical protein
MTAAEGTSAVTRRTLVPGSVPARIDFLAVDVTDWLANVSLDAYLVVSVDVALDGVNYRTVSSRVFSPGDAMPAFRDITFSSPARITTQSSEAVGDDAEIDV